MDLDFTRVFAMNGNRAVISMDEWTDGWVSIVGGINGIPTAQQFNAVSYLIESKANEAHRVASLALKGLDDKVSIVSGYGLMSDAQSTKLAGLSTGATKTAKSGTNGNVLVDGAEVQVYRHPTGAGNEHIPAGGTAGQVLQKTASGYAWGAVTPTDVEMPIKDAAAETTIADTDTVPFTDVSDSSKTKKITWTNLKALLNTWASALFAPKSHTHDDRYYTESEMDSKLSGKLGTTGDGKSTTVTFSEAASRVAPISGETQATLWGKVRKLFTDLKAVAFSGSYTDLSNIPSSFTPSAHNQDASTITTGILPVARGGLGAGSFTSGYLLMGNGTGAVSAVSPTTVAAKVGVAYGTCSTAAATTAKVVSASGFTLVKGARVAVTFTYGVPSGATLNVNSTGAKYIRWQQSSIFAGIINAGDTAELVYTGSYWYLLAVDKVAAGAISFGDAPWETIGAIASAGLASNFWTIGDTKQVVLSTGEIIQVRIEDFNHDNLTAGGKAPITIGMVNCLNANRQMNSSNTNVGSWNSSAMRTWMSTLLNQMPAELRAVIKQVNKLSGTGNGSTSGTQTTADKLWLFSEVEVRGSTTYSVAGEGTVYPLFVSDASRVKTVSGSASHWWLRSPHSGNTTHFCYVYSDGAAHYNAASGSLGVAVGFCI